ncbi:2-amino-4-hydroxy-6-hydroxymethyldihydropteridine diphosphokinase [Halobacteriovorax sp. GB3]|uniref:2-amino-4-hydroxy-6- hydroxymethyldihydropteridine diphosphokinase n=1 Tax=Halobacteriovorax sp. GB3 TaxID=2719615 RepID=UPI0023629E1A|nr:2-amino-4-hydroxy-6-hydroxymethyldihydropteridine diphosphokinase [Halobacteriovorax sp. GB3]MDD0854783.1 2-amino-4-hydroxy-6-hydroxymethyldihydropteridine diphosphokinase [Halobacteriovorax sp. GB3]
MSLVLALGTNLADRENNLIEALKLIHLSYPIIALSKVYESEAVDYCDQPDFYNMVIECELPRNRKPEDIMAHLLKIEKSLGRTRDIDKGPRLIDIDILFYGLDKINTEVLTTPHPRLFERSFVVLPLKELPYFQVLKKHFSFPKKFDNCAQPKFDIKLA